MDLGGPRKEFFALALREMKEKYFNPTREWSQDYETVGKIMGKQVIATSFSNIVLKLITKCLIKDHIMTCVHTKVKLICLSFIIGLAASLIKLIQF